MPGLPPCSTLVPIRVDAWSSDKSIRIIDSLLYDLSAPPPNGTCSSSSCTTTADHLAYQICADAEVMGMGRTVRHFTNRLEVWKPELQKEVARQIDAQLQAALWQQREATAGSTGSSDRRKRPYRSTDSAASSDSLSKKDTTEGDAKTTSTRSTTAEEQPASTGAGDGASGATAESRPTSDPTMVLPQAPTPKSVGSSCVRIRLRLSAYGVRVHDDLFVDPNVPESSPLLLARSIGDDLNLPLEVVQAVALEIAEQLRGRGVQDDAALRDGGDEGNPPSAVVKHPDNASAAWLLEQRVHISNVAHLVQQHKPEQSSSSAAPAPAPAAASHSKA